jgi:hypothetical protein
MQRNHNVPFRNSSSLCSLLSVLPLQLKLRQKGELGAKSQQGDSGKHFRLVIIYQL